MKTKADPLEQYDPPKTKPIGHRISLEASEMLRDIAATRGWKIQWALEVCIRDLYKKLGQ